MPLQSARVVLDATLSALADVIPQAADQLGPLLDPDLVGGTLEHLERMHTTSDD